MHDYPAFFALVDGLLAPWIPVDLSGPMRHSAGFVVEDRRPLGLVHTTENGTPVGVLGCVSCHGGRAAGRTIIGLGNKNIDVGSAGALSLRFDPIYRWTRHLRRAHERRLIDQAAAFTRTLANESRRNETQGLIATAVIRDTFLRLAGASGHEAGRGQVKVPHLWGYAEKRGVGLFADGFGDGATAGWAAAVELVAGQTPEVVHAYHDRLERVEEMFARFLPPEYPYAIDPDLRGRGELVFVANCGPCHGSYRTDPEGLPIYAAPRWIPIEVVGTDPERTRLNTPEYRRALAVGPLADIVKAHDLPPGYLAPRLEGIWSRFPYLHNASVPSLAALLTEPEMRPAAWSLRDAGEEYRFDRDTVGLTLPAGGGEAARDLLERGRDGARDVYFTGRIGHSSRGHRFGIDLPATDKRALIEYLKSL